MITLLFDEMKEIDSKHTGQVNKWNKLNHNLLCVASMVCVIAWH